MKPYQQIPILDCQEPLVPIPVNEFSLESPPPYQKLGADYGAASPFVVRSRILTQLQAAQAALKHIHPDWRLHIFDAYRPLSVQQFMVDYTYQDLLNSRGLKVDKLSAQEQDAIWADVYKFWAMPNANPAHPPPHSTGAAIDLTLMNLQGERLPMGGEIDAIAPYSEPDFYADSRDLSEQQYHQHRQVLHQIMQQAGFRQHPHEWWHFSCGDQLWCWLNQTAPLAPQATLLALPEAQRNQAVAIYGRADLLSSPLAPSGLLAQ